MSNVIKRDTDVVYGRKDFETLHTFKNFPAFMGCTDEPSSTDILEDLNCQVSRGSGVIQVNPVMDPRIVYNQPHGSGTVGKSWSDHHTEMAKFIRQYNPSDVLEIGASHGILSDRYFDKSTPSSWTIIDPNPLVRNDSPVKIIKGMFTKDTELVNKYDTVIHSHVFEHIYNPNEFLQKIHGVLKDGGRMIFSMPDLEHYLTNKMIHIVSFEHTLYMNLSHVIYLLFVNGFRIDVAQRFGNGHSVFISATKDTPKPNNSDLSGEYTLSSELFRRYINHYQTEVDRINNQITSPVYLFGGHVFSQFLISFGLDVSKIKCIIDNDVKKHGKRLYGTNLVVNPPSILKDEKNPVVILKAGAYNKEIRDGLINNINSTVKTIE